MEIPVVSPIFKDGSRKCVWTYEYNNSVLATNLATMFSIVTNHQLFKWSLHKPCTCIYCTTFDKNDTSSYHEWWIVCRQNCSVLPQLQRVASNIYHSVAKIQCYWAVSGIGQSYYVGPTSIFPSELLYSKSNIQLNRKGGLCSHDTSWYVM